MIKEFPNYTPISLAVKKEIEDITSLYAPYADFNFVNLHSWNTDNTGAVALLNENLVVRYPSYVNDSHFLTFLGDKEVPVTVKTLLDAAEPEDGRRRLQIVPQIGAAALGSDEKIQVIEDPNNHDYIISLSKLTSLQGRKLRRFRRAVNCFGRHNGQLAEFVRLDLTDQLTQHQIVEVFTSREAQKPASEPAYELQAMQRLLHYSSHYQLRSYGLAIDTQLKAFIIAEDLGKGWSIGHFWKADIAYRGIYSYFMLRAAEVLGKEGVELMNIQADLGITGLRFFKTIFDPVGLLKKYTIERFQV